MSSNPTRHAIRNNIAAKLAMSETGFFLEDYLEKVPHKTSREFASNRGLTELLKFLNAHPRIESACLTSVEGFSKWWLIDKARHDRTYPDGWFAKTKRQEPTKIFVAQPSVEPPPALQLALEKALEVNITEPKESPVPPTPILEEKEMPPKSKTLSLNAATLVQQSIPENMDLAAMAALGQQLIDAAKKAERDQEQKQSMVRIQALQLEIAGATATIIRLTDEQLTATMRLEKASNELKILMSKINQ